MPIETNLQAKTRSSGQVIFVLAAVVFSLLLLSQITTQTVWIDNSKSVPAQPRFWPAVALLLMVFGFGLHLLRMRHRRPRAQDWAEARRWLEPLEYVGWFMGYVFAVPIVGFLPMSVIFACGLTYRLGYRGPFYIGLAALFALVTVMIFKAFLGVRIPGAALYEILPNGLRSFFILYV